MPRTSDALLVESVSTHRRRLRQALLFGRLDDRRQTTDNVRRFVGGIVLAAVVGVGCLGVSFVTAATAQSTSPQPSVAPQQQSVTPQKSTSTPQSATAARTSPATPSPHPSKSKAAP